jgi:hypothetical protein
VSPEELYHLAKDFLALIKKDLPPSAEDEERLQGLLDHLALARYMKVPSDEEKEYPEPQLAGYEDMRKLVKRRFPNYGFYNVASPVSEKIADAEIIVGDAIDDVADIAGELEEFLWRWDNTSKGDALKDFLTCRFHWEPHIRGLQFYICSIEHRGGG